MSNLQKFENTLVEFDHEVSKLKSIGEVHQEIKKLANEYEIVVSKIQNNNQKLEDLLNQYDKFQKEIKEDIYDIKKQQSHHKNSIIEVLNSKILEIQKDNKQFSKELVEVVDVLGKENKQFHRDLDETLRIKLSENKTEIKQFFETENLKLKDVLISELEKRTDKILKRQNYLIITICSSLGIILIILIFIIYKLLNR